MKYVFMVCLLLLVSKAQAFSVSNMSVEKVFVGYGHGGIFFSVATEIQDNPKGCGVVGATFSVDPSLSNVEHVLSVLLAAHLSDRSIDFEVYDTLCFQNHRVIRKIVIQ